MTTPWIERPAPPVMGARVRTVIRSLRSRDEDAPLAAEGGFSDVLASLPTVERSALALSEIAGLDEEEIAERLGTSVPVVQALLVRARVAARSRLRERRAHRPDARPQL